MYKAKLLKEEEVTLGFQLLQPVATPRIVTIRAIHATKANVYAFSLTKKSLEDIFKAFFWLIRY